MYSGFVGSVKCALGRNGNCVHDLIYKYFTIIMIILLTYNKGSSLPGQQKAQNQRVFKCLT